LRAMHAARISFGAGLPCRNRAGAIMQRRA
jgi:hypothetical protein